MGSPSPACHLHLQKLLTGAGRRSPLMGTAGASSPFQRRPAAPLRSCNRRRGCCDGAAAAECAASACVLCVCCPLTLLWCALKLPCKVAWRASRRAVESVASASCCGGGGCRGGCSPRRRRVLDASSSFSDLELELRAPAVRRRRRQPLPGFAVGATYTR